MTTKYIEELIRDPRNKTYLSYQTFWSKEGKRWFLDIRDIRYKKEVFKARILDEEIEDYRCIIREAETERVRKREELRLLETSSKEMKIRAIEREDIEKEDIKGIIAEEVENIGGEGDMGGEGKRDYLN